MTFSKNIKIIIGLATSFYSVAPFILVGVYFIFILSMIPSFSMIEEGYNPEFPAYQFFFGFILFFGMIMLFNVLHFVLIPIYMTLLIKNKDGLEVLRIILAVGLIFLPFVAMPAYFLIYILPATIPGWASEVRSLASPQPSGAQ
jgi:hypothetical protein